MFLWFSYGLPVVFPHPSTGPQWFPKRLHFPLTLRGVYLGARPKTPQGTYGYGSIPISTIFSGMNIHLPAILMFTRGTRF